MCHHWGSGFTYMYFRKGLNVSLSAAAQILEQLNEVVFDDPLSRLSRGSDALSIYRKGIQRYAKEFTRNLPMEAEDLLEQVYLEFIKKIERGWVPDRSLRNAFIRTLQSRSIDAYRRLPKQPVAESSQYAQELQRLDPVKYRLEIEALLSEQELLEKLTYEWEVEQELDSQANRSSSFFEDGTQWEEIELKCAIAAEALAKNFRELSGALTWMTLSAHSDIELDDAPTPKAGVGSDQVVGWPSLWFASHDRTIFNEQASKAEVRKRQRQMNAINNLRLAAQSNVAMQLGVL